MGDLVQFVPRSVRAQVVADCAVAPQAPPVTREHQLEAALLIVQADLEVIERKLAIEPDSIPLHIPVDVAEALYRSLRTIARAFNR